MALSYNLGYQESISVHPTRRHIFAGKSDSTFLNIWQWVIYSGQLRWFVLLSPKIYPIIPKALMSCYQSTLKPSKRPFMIPAKPIVFIESNWEYKIPYLAAVGDSDKLKRQDQPSPGQHIYKMSGSTKKPRRKLLHEGAPKTTTWLLAAGMEEPFFR